MMFPNTVTATDLIAATHPQMLQQSFTQVGSTAKDAGGEMQSRDAQVNHPVVHAGQKRRKVVNGLVGVHNNDNNDHGLTAKGHAGHGVVSLCVRSTDSEIDVATSSHPLPSCE